MAERSSGASRRLLLVAVGVLSVACGAEFTFRVVDEPSAEAAFWQSVRDTVTRAGLTAYLERWPDGEYAALARRRLADLGDRPGRTDLPAPVEFESPAPGTLGEADPGLVVPGLAFGDCGDCPEMVVLPSGTFRMGSTDGQLDERPVRDVWVETFSLGRHEITRGEFGAFAATTNYADRGCSVIEDDGDLVWDDRASWRNPGFPQAERHPVVCVSWEGAEAYGRWLSRETGERYRLPSEAEWEYGARAGMVTRRYWESGPGGGCEHANGGDRTLMEKWRGWPFPVVNCVDRMLHTSKVGSFAPNAFGLHDMLGNVWEWTADCVHENYSGAPVDGSAWIRSGDCGRRVLRGGSWETPLVGLRAANRYWQDNRASNTAGFRVARDLR